eukprot:CAMPEP_0181103862 /NCGR_PEP_ID=MMETSP1071-20121207/15110_1 /TAXON_ID=35127 /ORGANISM="Thalassiosira sp., Strain NH16" /LENGTH=573 /DNA_ID=CAMNT_0023187001 /DNA_START=97 /DNA_END=1815 /DNA_ORIENTATION=+
MDMMMRDNDENVDIPEGMDPDDAISAIKLLHGADQIYRSALRDFANYEKTDMPLQGGSKERDGRLNARVETSKKDSAATSGSTRRKRLRRSRINNNNNTIDNDDERQGRITHLHVTGIASMFLPSWDLSFVDVAKLDCLVSLKLNGCDSVPPEVFFGLPRLRSMWLINCQELADPSSCYLSKTNIRARDRSSTIEHLDIREGGLWGHEFLSALRLILPWMSPTLKSLKLSHTPYASWYNNTYATTSSTESSMYNTSDGAIEDTEAVSEQLRKQRIEDGLLQQTMFHETMGKLLLDALLSLVRRDANEDSDDVAAASSPLEYLSLSFFNSLLDRDVSSLLVDVVPQFSHLVTLHLPHHTISNLKIASERISDQQEEFRLQPDKVLSLSPPLTLRTSFLSTQSQVSIASVSRLRRLWLKPTPKHRADGGDSNTHRSDSNQDDKAILVSLLTHFPELSCVARSGNHKGSMYSPCPCCCRCNFGNCCGTGPDKGRLESCNSCASKTTNQAIEYLLRMNHSGRCLLEGLRRNKVPEEDCPLSLWPLVLERAWKVPPPDFCSSSGAYKTMSDPVSVSNT